ncbi:type I secretion system permease/ATPase [Povalibacter sp.]|uniref:type I secretion system permease/ATPase n=1 Tax=Povalibacter sp. TaxID=1962978 RepID=UPI002F40D02C
MRWLFLQRLRPFVLLAGGASLILNLALLMPALYMMQVFDRVFSSRSMETLGMLSALVALALALGYVVDTVRARALAWAGRALDRELSPAALAHTLHQAAVAPAARKSESLRDITVLRNFLSGPGILALFDAPWLPLYLLIIGLMHPLLGILAAVGAGALVLLGLLTEKLTRQRTTAALQGSRAMSQQTQMLTRNAEVIAGMGMTRSAVAGWQRRQDTLLETQAALGNSTSMLSAVARISRQALQVIMLGVGAWLVIGAEASAGIMVAATILLGRALQPVEQLIGGWKGLLEARGAWQRLSAPDEGASLQAASMRVALPAPGGRLDLERVVFSVAAGRPALIKGVSFSLQAGESLGLVGPSASGKTTLIRLLIGIRQPQSGVVRLDGADIAQWDRDALGVHIGYLPQDVELFPGTVAENIARLGNVDSSQVVKAAQLAHAHEMILRLPQGYDTQIGEAGAVLSGGQRQRIALARALFGSPTIVVLDEPNANLDADGEAALLATFADLKALGTTLIMVSHRPALMSQLDKLALLRDGAIEAFGPTSAVLPRLRIATPRLQPVAAPSTASEAIA